VARDGRTAMVTVPVSADGAAAERAAVDMLRDRVARTAPGGHALVTGDAARSADFAARMSSAIPLVIGFVLALAFALLLWAFRSPKLATLRLLDMEQMGVGLAAAVLLDVTIVRAIALPAAIALLGEDGWRVKRRRAPRPVAVEARA
jgi:uncharacterized membrane protein YdfJ with MMPL/SSD domain